MAQPSALSKLVSSRIISGPRSLRIRRRHDVSATQGRARTVVVVGNAGAELFEVGLDRAPRHVQLAFTRTRGRAHHAHARFGRARKEGMREGKVDCAQPPESQHSIACVTD